MVKAWISLTLLAEVSARSNATFQVRNLSAILWIGSNSGFISWDRTTLRRHSGRGGRMGGKVLNNPFMNCLMMWEEQREEASEVRLYLERAARWTLTDAYARPDFARDKRWGKICSGDARRGWMSFLRHQEQKLFHFSLYVLVVD